METLEPKPGKVVLEENKILQTEKNAADRIRLLKTFPEEVWLAIFQKMENADDLFQISNANPLFRNLLYPRRTQFLFPLVWQILGKLYETSNDPVYMEHTNSKEYQSDVQVSNTFNNKKWFSGVLKCRQVCKCWCEAVDNFYRNYENIYRFRMDTKFECNREVWGHGAQNGEWTQKYFLCFSADLRKFVAHFQQTHLKSEVLIRSPFLANMVHLKLLTDCSEFTNEVCKILEIVGKHVWHCNLGIQEESPDLHLDLLKVLKILPNLKSLRLWYYRSFFEKHSNFDHALQNSIPVLTNLKFIEMDNVPPSVGNQLLESNNHITMFELGSFDENNFGSIFSRRMPNLKHLSLKICSRAHFDCLKSSSWKLSKIYLDFSGCCYIEWSEIFQVFEEKWSDTATNVGIHFPGTVDQSDPIRHMSDHVTLQLNLPNVRRLKVELTNLSSIDFTLPMKNTLAQLEIVENVVGFSEFDGYKKSQFQRSIKESEIIEFSEPKENFYYSNIWTELPKLKSFHYQNIRDSIPYQVYTRLFWNQKMKKYNCHL